MKVESITQTFFFSCLLNEQQMHQKSASYKFYHQKYHHGSTGKLKKMNALPCTIIFLWKPIRNSTSDLSVFLQNQNKIHQHHHRRNNKNSSSSSLCAWCNVIANGWIFERCIRDVLITKGCLLKTHFQNGVILYF